MLYLIPYAALLTALASAAHGGDYLGKGWIMLIHTLLFPPAILFWMFLRGSKQAKAELDYMTGKGDIEVVRAAYPLKLGRIIAPAIEWSLAHHAPHLNPSTDGIRTQQELIGGAICGMVLGVLTVGVLYVGL